MKGLMVTLLVLSCTGMVWAQQEYNSGLKPIRGTADGTAFGKQDTGLPPVVPIEPASGTQDSLRSTSHTPEQRTGRAFGEDSFGTRSFPNRPTDADHQHMADRSTRRSSATSGMLDSARTVRDSFPGTRSSSSARIGSSSTVADPRRDVIYLGIPPQVLAGLQKDGSVRVQVENPDVKRISISDRNEPTGRPTVTLMGELRGDAIVFEFDKSHLDNIRNYAFEYEVPQRLRGRYRTVIVEYPPALESVASNRVLPRTDSRFRSDDSRWRLAGDTSVRVTEPDRRPAPWEQNNRLSDVEYQKQLAYQKWLEERESRQKQDMADENRRLKDQLDRLRLQQQQALLGARSNIYPDRYANRPLGDGTYPGFQPRPVVPPVNDSMTQSMMQKMRQMEDRFAQLDRENRSLQSTIQTVRADRDELLRRRFNDGNNYRNELAENRSIFPVDDRTEKKPAIGEKRVVLSTGGFGEPAANKPRAGSVTDSPQRQRGSWDLLMFLMLLCSVGLNLYLWALSRGFYMRYQELADELRETFTVTA